MLEPVTRKLSRFFIRNWFSWFFLLFSISVLAGFPAEASRTATTTALSVTSAGSTVTTVTSGSVVTLTAAVNAGPTAIAVGQVSFCDAAAALCTDVHLFGTAQLTKAGTAVLKFRPGIGNRSYKAIFSGTSSFAASTSGTATLLVTGPAPTVTSIASSGSSGKYQLSATVVGVGSVTPSGTVSFLDTSNSNTVLGTALLGNGVSGLNFVNSWTGPAGQTGLATNPLVADLNGDGNLDLIESGSSSIFVLLGNGDGTFSTSALNSGGQAALAVGDFNGDGILDLLVTSGSLQSDTVTVWLGNGDGTFTPTGTNVSIGPAGSNPWSGTVGDFNGDGILDAAILVDAPGGTGYSLTVLLGNGDGTFTPASTSTAFPNSSHSFAVGDFNGDGILDLAAPNTVSNSVSIFLGNGDGTFSPAVVSPATGTDPGQMVAGDFNQDGKLDLVVQLNSGLPNQFTVLLGNGDGTFTPSGSSPSIPILAETISVGDFNGDGNADLFVVAQMGVVYVLEGNGDGTFTTVAGAAPQEMSGEDVLAAGDFNGDGATDIAVVYLGGQVTVQLSANQRATASATGISVPVATGTHQVIASYPGDSNYRASTSAGTGLASAVGTSTVSLTPSANPVSYGSGETLTATVQGSGFTPTGTVTFIDGIKQLGTGVLNSSGVATFLSNTLAVGAHSVAASYAGDTNYNAADSNTLQLTVNPGTPTATLTTSGILVSLGAPVMLTATLAGGGATPTGTVTFSDGTTALSTGTLANGVATYSNSALAIGSHTLTASYSGDNNYISVISAPVTVSVSKGFTSTLTATPSAATITNQQTDIVTVSVTGGSGQSTPTGAVTLVSGSFSTMQTLSGANASFTIPSGTLSDGANTLTATYSGDATYMGSSSTTTITVSQVVIAAASLSSPILPGASATANLTLSAGSAYSGTMNLSCTLTGSPASAQSLPTCSLNPATVSISSGGSGSSALTVNTTSASSSALAKPSKLNPWGLSGGGTLLAGLLLVATPPRRRRWMTMLALFWVVVVGGAVSCGGGGGPSPVRPSTPATTAGSYTFTVSGSDSTNSKISTSTSISITVQ